tara:strand:+ start:595 stop:822 length:228 start_codon:yes stop_codon:yes gene_type:complete
MIDFQKLNGKFNEQQYSDLKKLGQQRLVARFTGENFVDEYDAEFRAEDPRKKAIDEDQKKKEELLIKLRHNHKYH